MRNALYGCSASAFLGVALVACAMAADTQSSKLGASDTVWVTAAEPDTTIPNFGCKLLVREILRQAVLIAARDELGLSTHDMALRETMPVDGQARENVLDVSTAEAIGQFVRIRLRRGPGKEPALLYEKQIPVTLIQRQVLDYSNLIVAVEKLSRTELAEALRKTGLQGHPPAQKNNVTISSEIGKQLAEMNFFSQFAALRELHALERSQGRSVETLGGLVRAYANLGQLCSFHWNASFKALQARSLLYSQRLVELDSASPSSLRHRAYAKAFAGLHAAAIEDLQAARDADKKIKVYPPTMAQTPWEPLINALCLFDYVAADKLAAGDDELATMVAFMIVQHSGCLPLLMPAGDRALNVLPECYWIFDLLDFLGGVSLKHVTTVHGPKVLQETLPRRLREMPRLPKSVEEALDKALPDNLDQDIDPAWFAGASRPAIVSALVKAGMAADDQGEPSWEFLGRMLEDVSLVHVYRRLSFFYANLALPPENYQAQLPLAYKVIADHPYAPAVKCAVVDLQYYGAEIQELFSKLKIVDADIPSRPLAALSWYGLPETEPAGQVLWKIIQRHADDVSRDLELLAEVNETPGVVFYHRLRAVSPKSPVGASFVISELDDFDEKRYRSIEREFGDHPIVLRNLGMRYTLFMKYDDAERVLKEYVKRWPDIKGNRLLADVYLKQEKYDKWKDALDESLKYEDAGLDHAEARVEIAKYLMQHDRLDDAISYADDAARTGAGWALLCAADVHEAAGNLDRAGELMRANSERYMTDRYKWYFWCRKTGHGNEEESRNLCMTQVEDMKSSTLPADFDLLGDIYVMLGKKDLARKAYQSALEAGGADFLLDGISTIILADDAGHADARDVLLEKTIQRIPRNFPTELGFVMWLKEAYGRAPDAKTDDAALEKLIDRADEESAERLTLEYFAARHYQHRGRADLARKYVQRCLKAPYAARASTVFAMAGALARELEADQGKATNAPH
jgi:tetratricopeptide (TPR) repeat protein